MSQVSIPCHGPGSTIVCLGGGPSLTLDDLDACRQANCLLLAINNTYTIAPDAIALFAADRTWWWWHPDALMHQGLKFMFPPSDVKALPGVTVLRRSGQRGLEVDDRSALRSGGHSGYAGINLAAHLVGPHSRILLLGYDLQPSPTGEHHWHGEHPNGSHPRYAQWRDIYQTLLAPLAALDISLINCSRATAITGVPRASLADALNHTDVAVH